MNKALLVIDLQVCYLELNFTPTQREVVIHNTNLAIEKAHQAGFEIIYIKHYFDHPLAKFFFKTFFKGVGLRGEPKSVFDPRLHLQNKNILEKNTENTFKSTALDSILKEKNIDELFIAGLDGMACVQATTKGALQRDYKVTLIDNAIVSASAKRWNKLKNKLAENKNCRIVPSFAPGT